MRKSRRIALGVGAAALLGVVGARFSLPLYFKSAPLRKVSELSPRARNLVHAARSSLDATLIWDTHAHVVGLGHGGTGCFTNPEMQSHAEPLQRLKFDMYLAASGIKRQDHVDQDFVLRLRELVTEAYPQGKALLMAFDEHVRPDGTVDSSRSPFFVPNDYVARLCAESPQFGFIASVHPYRKDALSRLEKVKAAGAVAIKWLPNAMGMDPLDARCDSYFKLLTELGLPLISHTGEEQAVHAEEAQKLGNPLRLERALGAGVRVIAAHCASMGTDEDLHDKNRARVPSLHLFLRMMRDKRYEGNLFGDLSAVVLANRGEDVLRTLLLEDGIQERLVNGSDYPVIAVDPVISLSQLQKRGLLDEEELEPLREIFLANPLLFDLVLKRRLRVLSGGRTHRFSPRAFETAQLFATS